ncbi:hypothetical protein HW555_013214 [Spodoptera exigua]|uniref:Uncharacterized protein n=1 Tax=Spodoptera exigua TaxID=7107 RepID=A0A835KZZ9_SPOEX|nr:hypothetical protein HW555_013214 [Spodoptera exigua]
MQVNAGHRRPILVRFASITDKMKVWRAKTGQRGLKIGREGVPNEVQAECICEGASTLRYAGLLDS